MDELDSRLEKVFFENYCRDITEYQLAKSKRLERFISYMNQEIDNALKAQRPCTLLFADLMKMIMTVCDEISDHRYIAKIPELKKRAKSEATQLVKDNAIREVRQSQKTIKSLIVVYSKRKNYSESCTLHIQAISQKIMRLF